MRNEEVLAAIADEVFQAEMGQFNIEMNVRPTTLAGTAAAELEAELRASLNEAEDRARAIGAHIVMIGMLPTLAPEHLTADAITAHPRYALINEQIFAARGEDLHIAIDGPERLDMHADTIAPEAACTSTQFHLQVSPQDYAAHWNAAQCIAGVQVALGANSPFLFGKELWRETRIALFEQATDTRPQELKAQGVRPRVWFGERFITSVFDHFEENVRYFPSLLPVCDEEDPVEVLDRGDIPRLSELRMHNGTIYRWNRPVYDIHAGRPHLRVENRVLPAGPTVVDVFANGAFYYGLLRTLAAQDRPVWSQMSFATAEENFNEGARHGIDAQLYWPGLGTVPVTELVLRRLLPMAQQGLADVGRRHRGQRPAAGRHRAPLHRLPQRRGVAGRDVPPDRRAAAAAGPARRAARDAAPLQRAHARQRAGRRLARRLRPDPRRRTGQLLAAARGGSPRRAPHRRAGRGSAR